MVRTNQFGRSLLFVIGLVLMFTPAAQASGDEYYFEQNNTRCGDFAPINPDLKQRTNGERYQVYLEFEITEEQIAAYECAGSHFDVRFYLSGFDELNDWGGCAVDYDHDYTFGWDIIDTGDGTAMATVYGVKLTDNRLNPGDVYWIEVNCAGLWADRHGDPSVGVEYAGAWYSIDPDEGALTGFETDETEINPGGLPVYVEYTGQTAQLVNWDWETEFPFQQGHGV